MPFSWQDRAGNFCFNMGTLFPSPTNLHFHHLIANYHIEISLISLNMAVRELKQGYLPVVNISKTTPDGLRAFSFQHQFCLNYHLTNSDGVPTYFQHTNFLYVSSRFAFDNSYQSSPCHFHHAFPMFFVWQF